MRREEKEEGGWRQIKGRNESGLRGIICCRVEAKQERLHVIQISRYNMCLRLKCKMERISK